MCVQRDAAQAGKEQASWARKSGIVAIFGVVVGVLTLLAAGAAALYAKRAAEETGKSAKAAAEALELAHKEFISTHRPRLRVRGIVDHGSGFDNFWTATIIIVNVGETEAVIDSMGMDIALRRLGSLKWLNGDPDISVVDKGPPHNGVLIGGASHVFGIRSGRQIAASELPNIMSRIHELCAVGLIRYRDGNGVTRYTGFLWKWDPIGERFDVSGDPQYAYED